ncbi:N-acetyltransferase [Sinimarinibacterium sp. CAU 1509]|nr:N-acetyltransferase [Sinimarinibacterium sp. CAU 1509]
MPTDVRIRPATEADGAALAAIYAPHIETLHTSFEDVAPDAAAMAARIAALRPLLPWLVAESDGNVLGYAYASRHRERAGYQWSVDVAIYLRDDARRQGLGRRLYQALFPILRRQGYYNAYAGIALPNPASVALHESLGFAPVGVFQKVGYKHGAWHDVGWWQRALQPHADAPSPPRPLAQLSAAERGLD